MPRPRSGPQRRPTGRFVLSIPPNVAALPRARHHFSQWLAQRRVAKQLSGELAIAFSELTSNAVNAAANDAFHVHACAWCDGTDLVLEVANAGPGPSRPARRWELRDQLRSGGRGLQMVRALVDSVEADRDDQGRLVVRCRRSLIEGS